MYVELKTKNLLDLSHTIAKDLFEKYEYPWQILSELSEFITVLGNSLPEDEYKRLGKDIWVSKSAKIAPSAYLQGPLIICADAEIRHCAFIRGSAIVGKGAVVGNSTELKNSVLFDNVQTPHYNYIGDSVLGYKAHTGAGTITSNLKSDKSLIEIALPNERVQTSRKKFGAIIGDFVEVGCNSVLNPGTVIGRNTSVYPLSMVRGYVREQSIYKNQGEIARKLP